MVRVAAVGFGAATMLALAASMTPGGQAVLGMRHLPAAQAEPVKVIQDRPASIHAPLRSVGAAPVAPAASPLRVTSTPPSSRARAQVHAATPPAPRPQAASAPLGQPFQFNQLLQVAQSPAMPNVFPTGGTVSGNAFLPSILQQFANPVTASPPPPAVQPAQEPSPTVPAQPNPANVAVNLVNNGGGRDPGDEQK